jgi:arylsulfatase A-like enzyme
MRRKLFIKQADVFGAYLAYTDHEIGRVIQAVEDLGQLDNTLIIYISGDNGASAEGMLNGTPNEFTTFNGVAVPVKDQFLWYEFWGSDKTFPHFAAPWAWAMDTPFKWTKQVASHFGGTAQGVAMSWPGHINDAGGIRRQFHHVIDIVPTILEATGIAHPDDQRHQAAPHGRREHGLHLGQGERQRAHPPHHAILRDARQPRHLSRRLGGGDDPGDAAVGTEHQARARRDHRLQWELYNVMEDPTQSNDLAAKMPDKLKQMQDIFYAEAQKHDVLPLDNSSLTRWNTPRPNLTAGRKVFTYTAL